MPQDILLIRRGMYYTYRCYRLGIIGKGCYIRYMQYLDHEIDRMEYENRWFIYYVKYIFLEIKMD